MKASGVQAGFGTEVVFEAGCWILHEKSITQGGTEVTRRGGGHLTSAHGLNYIEVMAQSFPLGRRFLAWILDNLLIAVVTVGLVLVVGPNQCGLPSLIRELEKTSPEPKLEDLERSLQALSADEWQAVNQALADEVLPALESQWPGQVLDQIGVLLGPGELLQKILQSAFQRLTSSERLGSLSIESRRQLAGMLQKSQGYLEKMQLSDILALFWRLVQPLILLFCLVPLVWFFPEFLFGWSLGKLALGLRVGRRTREGIKPAGLMNGFFRWLVKGAGWWVFILGMMMELWIVLAVGAGLGLVLALGNFGIFNDSFQTLHDGLSGTVIVVKKELETSQTA